MHSADKLLGITLSALCMTRYIGILVVPFCLIVVAFCPGSVRKRLVYFPAILAILVTVPISLFLWRNFSLIGSLTGSRSSFQYSYTDRIYQTLRTAGSWFYPIYLDFHKFLLAAAISICGIVLIVVGTSIRIHLDRKDLSLVVGLFLAIGLPLYLAVAQETGISYLDDRLLSPFAVPLMIAVALSLDAIVPILGRRPAIPLTASVGLLLVCIPASSMVFSLVSPSGLLASGDSQATALNSPNWLQSSAVLFSRTVPI